MDLLLSCTVYFYFRYCTQSVWQLFGFKRLIKITNCAGTCLYPILFCNVCCEQFWKKFANLPMQSMNAMQFIIFRDPTFLHCGVPRTFPKWCGYKDLSNEISHVLPMQILKNQPLQKRRLGIFLALFSWEMIFSNSLWTKYRGCSWFRNSIKLRAVAIQHARVVCPQSTN